MIVTDFETTIVGSRYTPGLTRMIEPGSANSMARVTVEMGPAGATTIS